jgi:hypothetical protein
MQQCASRVDIAHTPPFRAINRPANAAVQEVALALDSSVSLGVILDWALGFKGRHLALRFTRPCGRYEELCWPDPRDRDVEGILAKALFRVYDATVEPSSHSPAVV